MRREIAEGLAGLDISDADRATIRAAVPLLERIMGEVGEDFRAHVRAGAGDTSTGRKIAALSEQLTDHWMQLLADGVDDAYARRITRLGITHRERGLSPKIYIRSYGWLAARLTAEVVRHRGVTPDRCAELVAAVLKVLFFDLTMAVRAHEVALVD